MSGATYSIPAGRINKVKGRMLGHAIPTEVLGITGVHEKMPENAGDTIVFRRWVPYGGATTNATTLNQWVVSAAAHITQEGVTPNAESITAQDIEVILQQYSCLYMYTDKAKRLHEDDIPAGMEKQTGERMGLVREMIRYGALKQCTNLFYAGGTSRATVDEAVDYDFFSRIARSLMANHGKPITSILDASPKFNTAGVQAGFLVFCHTDLEHDILRLEGFKEVVEYGQRKTVHENEIGSCGRFRFIVSPELSSIPDSGAAVGSTGLKTTTGSNIDVYPVIVVAEDAWGDVALRGGNSFTPTHVPVGQKDKSDPLGQRGYVGAIFWSAASVLNNGWMALGEAGATNL